MNHAIFIDALRPYLIKLLVFIMSQSSMAGIVQPPQALKSCRMTSKKEDSTSSASYGSSERVYNGEKSCLWQELIGVFGSYTLGGGVGDDTIKSKNNDCKIV